VHTRSAVASAGLVQHRPVAENAPDMIWDFNPENADKVKWIMAKFPSNYKASAVMPLLVRAAGARNADATAEMHFTHRSPSRSGEE
jgi:NADH:ubiquinone oxidoreductase subunit E